ncbi:MmgE/PrpD family protein [Bradyrhizobium sp. 83002]|uniref:MmgE/PrpD family protein n=1 Tax=Bradyrhizobium aeschynomenes TaxID=2734909 RepID=UPI0015542092|nr:MmgE/PrpD family protein [Bradyrhizobium aeschynomenes]NPU13432.1 MmgE/PrpD family protein [Bradyrhizobium aeschynomenes]
MTYAVTEMLAEWVGASEVPEEARISAAKCVFDLMTAAIAGYETPNAMAVRRIASMTWGHGTAAMWFSGEQSTAAGATFVNAACACSLDLDDGHRAASGHPGAAIIPGVLSLLGSPSLDGQRALAAIAVGYEMGVRISSARDLRSVPTVNSGLWSGQAVAAAVGWLRGLSPGQIAHAISIAGTTAPSQSATPYTRFRGNSVKEGIPWGAANGVLAVDLAKQGFTGPIDILDSSERYDRARLLDGLGASWLINSTYFKPYSCCRWIHAPIDALLSLLRDHDIHPDAIIGIHVETFGRSLTLSNEVAPGTLEGAQYSLPFCLGVAAISGAAALLPLSSDSLRDQRAIEIAGRVRMTVNPEFDLMFPAAVPGRVRITTASGVLEQTVLAPKGEPTNPMSWDDIGAKFLAIAAERVGTRVAAGIPSAIGALQTGDLAPLQSMLEARLFADANSASTVERRHRSQSS